MHKFVDIVADDAIRKSQPRRKKKKERNVQDVVEYDGTEREKVAVEEAPHNMEEEDRPNKKKRKRNHGDPAKWKKILEN